MKIINQFKFKTQLKIYFSLIILLVVISIMIVLYVVLRSYYFEQEDMALHNQAKQIAQNIENKLDYYNAFLEILVNDDALKEYLEEGVQEELPGTSRELTDIYYNLNAGKIRNISICENFEKREDQSYNTNVYQDSVLSSGTRLNINNEKYFSIYKQIYLSEIDRTYYLEMEIYETDIFSLFNEDHNGNLIVITDNHGKIISMSDRDSFNQLLETREEIGAVQLAEQEEAIQISARNSAGWEAKIYTNTQYLERGYLEMTGSLFPVLLLILALAFFLSTFLSAQMNRRLKFLQEKIASIGSPDFYKNIKMEGEDEFTVLSDEVDNAREQIYQLLEKIRDGNKKQTMSHMKALRAQINSHFLFNALASIKWLSRQDKAGGKVSEAIDELAVFLRYSVAIDENLVPVRREVEQLNAYIYLQKLRCGDDLNVTVDVEEEIMELRTVKLILQPAVENAFFHGRRTEDVPLNVMIYSYFEDDYYYLVVEDDGRGIGKQRLEELQNGRIESKNSGYGLKNVMKRVELCTGGEGSFIIESKEGVYTKVTICQKIHSKNQQFLFDSPEPL